MSIKRSNKTENTKSKEKTRVEVTVPANFGAEMLRIQHSPFFEEIERIASNFQKYQDSFNSIVLTQQKLADSVFLPMNQLTENIKALGMLQSKLTEGIQKSSLFKEDTINSIINYQSLAQDIVLKSGILEIANSFKGGQMEAFSEVVVKAEWVEKVSNVHNGISEISTVRNTQMLSGGILKVGIDKSTNSSFSSQVTYRKLEVIDTRVQLLDQNLAVSNQKIASLEKNQKDFMKKIENNPFSFFRVKDIKFISKNSQFVVNNEIIIDITPYSLMEDLCNVLFSGHQEFGEIWFFDSIQASWATLNDNEKADRLTWKQILTIVEGINTMFAKKTTKDDLIIIKKPKMLRLNPTYFSPTK